MAKETETTEQEVKIAEEVPDALEAPASSEDAISPAKKKKKLSLIHI